MGGLLLLFLLTAGAFTAHGQWSEGQIVYDPPAYGNFYSMKLGPDGPPLPWLPLYPTNMTVYALGTLNGVTAFAYDDRPQLNRGEDDPPTPGDPGEGEDPGVPLGRPTDIGADLYLDIGPLTNHFAWLALTNTVSGKYYQLLSAAAVTNSPWQLGQIVTASSSHTFFDNARTDYPTHRYFRGVGADVIASIRLHPDYNLAVEPATNGGTAQNGKFQITLNTAASYSVTVAYTISGTASNGVDYTLSGSGTISAGQTNAIIEVQPLYDTLPEFDESVTLTLVISNGYLVSPSSATATLKIYDPRPSGMAVAILDSGWTKFHGLSTTNWSYFTLPEAMKEVLRSDGTPYVVVSDLDIANGVMTNANGTPKYPILFCLANEVVRDDEIAPLTNYVANGGFVFAGSSAFTKFTNGSNRTDFALASQMGLSCSPSGSNWFNNTYFSKLADHRIVEDIPDGSLVWRMPSSPAEISWGTCLSHSNGFGFSDTHQIWQVSSIGAQVLVRGDTTNQPYLAVKQYGSGCFIYDAALEPLIAHGGFGPGMYAYMLFRRSIEWAFESRQQPVVKLSPWPYQFNSAYIVRHDLENYTNEVQDIEASAQFEHTNSAKGDYYFCTGTLREDAAPGGYDTNAIIASLRRAVTNYGATIGPHNGGLRNPVCNRAQGDYEYWHWGPDEVLDLPGGYDYASNSLAKAFADIDYWLGAVQTNPRTWVAPYFNATREECYSIQEQLNVKISGDQKLSPFPHWTLSTQADGKRYGFLSEPASDWFTAYPGYSYQMVAQSLEPWHPPGVHNSETMHRGVDFYYTNGFLINFYSHTLSTGEGDAGNLVPDYVQYCASAIHSNLWAANGVDVYYWWVKRTTARIVSSASTNGTQTLASVSIAGAQDANTAVELVIPSYGLPTNLEVRTNGVIATNGFRIFGQTIKVRVGTVVTNVSVQYTLTPQAQSDSYSGQQDVDLHLPTPGVMANDWGGPAWSGLQATSPSTPQHGTLTLTNLGGFTYKPDPGFYGTDCFTYQLSDGANNYGTATVEIFVAKTNALFNDDFARCTGNQIDPWQAYLGTWEITNRTIRGASGSGAYGSAFVSPDAVWSNYTLEAQIQFPAGAFGGGLGGRLNAGSTEHYAAWVYPEGSSGGSSVMKLVKFPSIWNSFTVLSQANLLAVGTGWHPLKLIFNTNHIDVLYHGTNVISVFDTNAPYLSGGISLDLWTDASSASYGIGVSNLFIAPYP